MNEIFKSRKNLIKYLKNLNKKTIIDIEENQDRIFDLTEKEILTDKEIDLLFTTYANIEELKKFVKNRNNMIDILTKEERKKKC